MRRFSIILSPRFTSRELFAKWSQIWNQSSSPYSFDIRRVVNGEPSHNDGWPLAGVTEMLTVTQGFMTDARSALLVPLSWESSGAQRHVPSGIPNKIIILFGFRRTSKHADGDSPFLTPNCLTLFVAFSLLLRCTGRENNTCTTNEASLDSNSAIFAAENDANWWKGRKRRQKVRGISLRLTCCLNG